MVGVITDDSQLSRSLEGRQWQLRPNQDGAYNRTLTVCDTASNGTGPGSTVAPAISYSFTGTQINLVGRPTADLRMQYTIDGSSARPAVLNTSQSAVGKDGVVIWSLDQLGPGSHSVRILPVAGTLFLDYLSYLPSGFSPRSQDTLVVDDLDPQIKYSDTWNSNRDFSTPAGSPLNTTVSRTNTPGSSFQFNFTGSTLNVFALRRPVAGTLSASYRLDNGTPENMVHFNGSQAVEDRWSLNQVFFAKDLVPSTHTLTVTVTEVTGNQEFVFDYLTFEATSSTRFTGPTPIPTTSTSGSSSSSGLRLNIGAIVGSIIAFILVAYVVRWIFRQRAVYTPHAASNNNQSYHLETTQVTTTYTQPYGGQQAYEGHRQDSWQPPPPPYVPPAPQQAPLQPQGSGWQPPPAPPPMPTPQPWQSRTAGEVTIPEPAVWHQPPHSVPSIPNLNNNVNAQPQIGGSPPTGPAPPPLPSLSPLSPQPPPPAAAVLHGHAPPPPRSPPPQARQDGPRSESPEFEEVPLEQLGLAPNPPNPPPPANATMITRPNEPGGGPPPPSGNAPAPSGGGASPGQNPGPRSSSGGPPAYSG